MVYVCVVCFGRLVSVHYPLHLAILHVHVCWWCILSSIDCVVHIKVHYMYVKLSYVHVRVCIHVHYCTCTTIIIILLTV